MRKPLAEKILVLGVDGMDPRFTKKMLEEGLMPNTQKFIDRGACRDDLVMLGGQPTVTPPMWTTMSTGAYPVTHGITCFFRHSKVDNLDTIEYNLDSANCLAEPLWNVFAEAGKKTMVWHWPGSSWPPTSDSPNLSVVDGTQPAFVNCGVAFIEDNILLNANPDIDSLVFRSKVASDGKIPCMINDLEANPEGNTSLKEAVYAKKNKTIMLTAEDGEGSLSDKPWDIVMSPLKDAQGHMVVKFLKNGNKNEPAAFFREYLKKMYMQTDEYLGHFLHLLDEGWSIVIASDHGQICPEYGAPLIGDMGGVNVGIMRELGYTAVKLDEEGNPTKEIDWANTKAIAQRGNHIYLNLKGRDPEGIVDPADQYEVEEQIMTDLYNYKDPRSGKRIISLALRNKDAVLLGLGGPESGDICYWLAEGYNYDHCDSLSTLYGFNDTSVSPIIIFSGEGVKQGVKTDRIIRQVDMTPTIAAIGGVRMPEQCEGAPAYQILAEDY